jgi:hypothetical protein
MRPFLICDQEASPARLGQLAAPAPVGGREEAVRLPGRPGLTATKPGHSQSVKGGNSR